MKAKLFLSALTLSAVMTTFVACDKDEPYGDSSKVVESEVVDPGMAEDVTTVDNGTEGTSLSYESWIVVYQRFADGSTSSPGTRAAFSGNKISVMLESEITNISATTEVSSFELAENVGEISYRELGSHPYPSQQFVTVMDSAVVYTVDRGAFTIEFVLPYQAAIYDDGITKVTMPYHKYANVQDKGGTMSDLEDETESGIMYQRKLYQHSISAEFNGKQYTVTADVVLKREQKEDVLLSKRVVDEGVELVSYDLENKTGVSRSWIEVEEIWSESGTKTVTKEVLLNNGLSDESSAAFRLFVNKQVSFSSLVVGERTESVSDYGERDDEYFSIKRNFWVSRFPISTTEDESARPANYNLMLTYETAVYSDEYITHEMPHLSFENAQCNIQQAGDWEQSSSSSFSMMIDISSKVSFGEINYSFKETGDVYYGLP